MFLEAPFNLLKTVHGMYNLQTYYRQSVYHYIDKLPIVTVIDRLPLCLHTLWAYASVLYGAMRPYFMELHPPRGRGFPHTDKVRIDTVLLYELGMCTVLDDTALIHNEDLIGVFNS